MIKEALKRIGLTEGECQVYEALVHLGTSSTGKIVKKANIGSSKVYEVLQRLHNKGLVSHVLRNGVKYFEATPPERLIDFLDDKKEQLTNAQRDIEKIIPFIKAEEKKADEKNQTVVYSGIQGPKIVLKEILEAGKKGLHHFGFGTDTDPYVKYLPHDLNNFIEQSKKLKFTQKLIFIKGFKSPNTEAKVRYLSKEYLFPVRTMIYGSKVAIVDFTKPITTVVIENKQIANSYKKHFEVLWKIAKS
jgi:sugar-specific transcriptional regulator TrmB